MARLLPVENEIDYYVPIAAADVIERDRFRSSSVNRLIVSLALIVHNLPRHFFDACRLLRHALTQVLDEP